MTYLIVSCGVNKVAEKEARLDCMVRVKVPSQRRPAADFNACDLLQEEQTVTHITTHRQRCGTKVGFGRIKQHMCHVSNLYGCHSTTEAGLQRNYKTLASVNVRNCTGEHHLMKVRIPNNL
jgi:hypothetical protein